MTYALDTNIIIHLLRDNPSVIMQYDKCIMQSIPVVIPPYVDFEICRGLRYSNAIAKERKYHQLCASCHIGEMRRSIWVKAASLYTELRHKGFTVKDADILIAAFCIEGGYTLVTNNTKDFMNIDNLLLDDWVR